VSFDEPSSGISECIDNTETAWFKVIRNNVNIDLHRLSMFNQKLSDDELELSKIDKTMLTLLKDFSSIMLRPCSTNEPFQPVLVMADGRRSAMPCDLTANDLELLSTAIVD